MKGASLGEKIGFFILLGIFSLGGGKAGKVKEVESKIERVVVYPGRAEVTRGINLPKLEKGIYEFKISGLPSSLEDNSVRVTLLEKGKAKIMGVRIKKVFLEKPREERIRELEEKIQGLKDKDKALKDKLEVLSRLREFVESIRPKMEEELSKGLLFREPRIGEWGKILEFLGEKLSEIFENSQEIEVRRREIARKIKTLEKELAELKRFRPREEKEIDFGLEVKIPSPLNLWVSYVIPGAGWRPLYETRIEAEGKKIEFSFYALVSQNTGEDWEEISLYLSTARPSIGGRMPELSPWWVGVSPTIWEKKVRFLREEIGKEKLAPEVKPKERETSVSFELPGKESIPSDGSPHRVWVGEELFEGKFSYSTTPKLSPWVYLKTSLRNTSSYPLLPGKINIFFQEDFVASSWLELVLPGEEFQLWLGVDENIKVKRELVKRFTEKIGILGKTKRTTYKFRIELKNHKKKKVKVLLWDQIPVSQSDKLQVKLTKSEPQPVEITEKGFLKWNLELPAGKKKEIYFEFYIQYPEQLRIQGI